MSDQAPTTTEQLRREIDALRQQLEERVALMDDTRQAVAAGLTARFEERIGALVLPIDQAMVSTLRAQYGATLIIRVCDTLGQYTAWAKHV